jgi:hypothetical protein
LGVDEGRQNGSRFRLDYRSFRLCPREPANGCFDEYGTRFDAVDVKLSGANGSV